MSSHFLDDPDQLVRAALEDDDLFSTESDLGLDPGSNPGHHPGGEPTDQIETIVFDDEAAYPCSFCGESNGIDVDRSAGRSQRYVQDCQVCCRPNVLSVHFDDDGRVQVWAEPES